MTILLMTAFLTMFQGGLGALGGLLPMLLIIGVFYMLLIRPQQKRQRELQQTISEHKAVDSGLLTYASPWPAVPWLCPPWIAVLWIQFGTTLRFGFRWLSGRPLLAAMVGAIGGPLAFRAGEALGAVRFAPDRRLSYGALAVVWGLCFPILTVAAARLPVRPGANR